MKTLKLEKPSVDGLGVKRYTVGYLVGGSQIVHVFDRPNSLVEHRFMIRVENRSGQHVETLYYCRARNVRRWVMTLFSVDAVEGLEP